MTNLNILIVEDESLIALELSQTITNLGYHVIEEATTPKMAKLYLETHSHTNLILMDINLSTHMTGIELYESLNTDIPVIYITAYKDEETIMKAINTNPLGYLVKPHNESELNALLKLAAYKMSPSQPVTLKKTLLPIGEDYYFDTTTHKLYYQDLFIYLGKKELHLLELLIQAKGNIVTLETIESLLWDTDVPSSSSLRTLIYRLRGKLKYKLIETVVGYGIKLV